MVCAFGDLCSSVCSNAKRCHEHHFVKVEWCILSHDKILRENENEKENNNGTNKSKMKKIICTAPKTSDNSYERIERVRKKQKVIIIKSTREMKSKSITSTTNCFWKTHQRKWQKGQKQMGMKKKRSKSQIKQWQHSVFWYLFSFVGFATYLRG